MCLRIKKIYPEPKPEKKFGFQVLQEEFINGYPRYSGCYSGVNVTINKSERARILQRHTTGLGVVSNPLTTPGFHILSTPDDALKYLVATMLEFNSYAVRFKIFRVEYWNTQAEGDTGYRISGGVKTKDPINVISALNRRVLWAYSNDHFTARDWAEVVFDMSCLYIPYPFDYITKVRKGA